MTIQEAKKFSIKPINFIDIGSGKGRICIYANKYYKFKNINFKRKSPI